MTDYKLSLFFQTIDNIKYTFTEKINNSNLFLKLFYRVYYLYIKRKLCNNVNKINILSYDIIMDFCNFANIPTNSCKATVYHHDDTDDNVKLEIRVSKTYICINIGNHVDRKIKYKIVNDDKTIFTQEYYEVISSDKEYINESIKLALTVIKDYIISYIQKDITI